MSVVAINTVEVQAVAQQSAALRARLGVLIETLQRIPGCAAYGLTRSTSAEEVWIVTGYWYSCERMEAHFNLPCLSDLFELAAEQLARRLQFRTYFL